MFYVFILRCLYDAPCDGVLHIGGFSDFFVPGARSRGKPTLLQLQRGGAAASRGRAEAAAGHRGHPCLGRPVHGVFVKPRGPQQPWTQALHTPRGADRARVGGERAHSSTGLCQLSTVKGVVVVASEYV